MRPLPTNLASRIALAAVLSILIPSASVVPRANADATWIPIDPTPPPAAVPGLQAFAPCASFDISQQRVVVFGGTEVGGLVCDSVHVLVLVTSTWLHPTIAGGPRGARHSASAVYDAGFQRTIVFGGDDGAPRNDVWSLGNEFGTWWKRLLSESGTPPPARSAHAAIFQSSAGRMIVFGGSGTSGLLGDVWSLTLGASPEWSQLTPENSGPSPRSGATAIYDTARDRMIVFGGYDGTWRNDVWALALSGPLQWTQLAPDGTPPAPRERHSAIYDPALDRMIVYGGQAGLNTLSDLSVLTLTGTPAWSHPSSSGTPPGALSGHVAVLDGANRMLVACGHNSVGVLQPSTWVLSLSDLHWNAVGASLLASPATTSSAEPVPAVLTSGSPPTHGASAFDPQRGRLIAFGGQIGSAGSTTLTSQSLVLDLGAVASWQVLTSGGPVPAARRNAAMVDDPTADRMLMFGGIGSNSGAGPTFNDLWEKSSGGGGAWSLLAPDGTPPAPRHGHAMVFDPPRRRVILFGGTNDQSNTWYSDLWQLTLDGTPAWSQLTPLGAPPAATVGALMVYDALRDRVLLFGGEGDGLYWSEVWELSLGTLQWTPLVPNTFGTKVRSFASGFYDPRRDRLVVWGGDPGGVQNEVRGLDLGSLTWSTIATSGPLPVKRGGSAFGYDALHDRLLIGGGGNLADSWALDFGGAGTTAVSDPGAATAALAISRLALNGSGFAEAIVTVPGDGVATLDLFDVHGRRVAQATSAGAPGRRTMTLGSDRRIPSGVYFGRLGQNGVVAVRKAPLLR